MSPKNYGRQAKGKTIKSISLESDLVDWIQEKATGEGMSFSAYINDFFRNQVQAQEVSDEGPNIMAAAGPGIVAEVVDWEGDDDTVRVKVIGESMAPLFNNGEVVKLKHKSVARSPYMKKGLIYLVQLDGGWMIKRYGTRKPRKNEKDAEYLTGSGSVGILKSENPNFPDIDITGPFEWAAWYDEK